LQEKFLPVDKGSEKKDVFRVSREGERTMSCIAIFTPRTILWSALLVFLVVVALREQLCLPVPERTWHGRICGRIPYVFRLPTAKPYTRRVLEEADGGAPGATAMWDRLDHQPVSSPLP